MNRIIFILALLALSLPLRAANPTFESFEPRSLKTNGAAPHRIYLNLDGPGSPDGPGDLWTFLSTNVIAVSDVWTNNGTQLYPVDTNYNWAFQADLLFNPTGHGQIGTTAEYLTATYQEDLVWARFGTADSRTFDSFGPAAPEGVIDADIGSIWRDTLDGSIWSKTSAVGSTGWVQLGGGGGSSFWALSVVGGVTNLVPTDIVNYFPTSDVGWFAGTNTTSRASFTFTSPFGIVSGPNGVKLHDNRGTFIEFSDTVLSPLQLNTDIGWDGLQNTEFLFRNLNLYGSAYVYGYLEDGSNSSRGGMSHGGTNDFFNFNSEGIGDAGPGKPYRFQIDSVTTATLIKQGANQNRFTVLSPDQSVDLQLSADNSFTASVGTASSIMNIFANTANVVLQPGEFIPATPLKLGSFSNPWSEVNIQDAGTLYFGTNTMTQTANVPLWNGAAWPGGGGGDTIWYAYTSGPDSEGGTVYTTANTNALGTNLVNFTVNNLPDAYGLPALIFSMGAQVADSAEIARGGNVEIYNIGDSSGALTTFTNCQEVFDFGYTAGALGTMIDSERIFNWGDSPGQGLYLDTVSEAFNIGTFTGAGMIAKNSISLVNFGDSTGSNSRTTNSTAIQYYGVGTGTGAINNDVHQITGFGHDVMNSANFLDSLFAGTADIIGIGHEALKSSIIDGTFDVLALNGLKGAHLTNGFSITSLGRGAGDNISGTFQNVVLIGNGSTASDGAVNQIIAGTSMKFVAPGGFSSLATDAAVAISATGYTNAFGKNVRVWMDGTNLTYTVYDAAASPYYTNAVAVGHDTFTLNTGEKFIVTVGAAIGVAKP